MRTFDQWMNDYGLSHRHPTNQLIHKICVPLIMFSVVGLIWAIPTPNVFKSIPYLNWATIFMVCCLGFYATLHLVMFLGMLIQTLIMCWISEQLQDAGLLVSVCISIFVISWLAQFWGHKIEGKKPSFMQDIVFLLIGPLWVLRFIFLKLGIKI